MIYVRAYTHENIILFAQTQARCIISKEVTLGIELSITIVWQPSVTSQKLGSPGQITVNFFSHHNFFLYFYILSNGSPIANFGCKSTNLLGNKQMF